MGLITSSIGLISGINTGQIVNELIAIEQQPVNDLNNQINVATEQQQVYTDLSTELGGLQSLGESLALPQTFDAADANTSDPTLLTATATEGAAYGSYQLLVSRLVSTQQTVSQGFANQTSAGVGTGTITFQEGGGQISTETPLAQLNGGEGISGGEFRITDRSGASAVIDTSDDVTLDDVVKQINSASGLGVTASLTSSGIQLTDTTGSTSGNLIVQNLNGDTTAISLGIAGSVASSTLTGTNINTIGTATGLNLLNDGNGVTTAGTNPDFSITTSSGATVDVTLGDASTVGDVIGAINTAGAGKVEASINSSGNGITLTDLTGGGSALTVTALNGSSAASQLGLTGTASNGVLTGQPVIAALDSTLISQLNGGAGLTLGTLSITNSEGQNASVDLSGATSVSDILSDINNAGINVTASLNASQTGIEITDNSGGGGSLTVGGAAGTTLGLSGTSTTGSISGSNLWHQYVSDNTLLSTYNGGSGVTLGAFQITNSKGVATTVDLSQGSYNTIGDVINAINAANAGVTASINAHGDGIELTDTAGGTGQITVAEEGSTTATNLNIVGTGSDGTLNGGLEKSVTVTSTDTLASLETKINNLNAGVTANIVNDGSASDPYRLSLTATNSGSAGQVVIDAGTTNLNMSNLVQGQDAAVFLGGTDGSQPLLVTSSTNTITNLINGVTLNLQGASSSPVTLNVTRDSSDLQNTLQSFTDGFNTLIDQINTLTSFDSANNAAGLLLGDETVLQVQEQLYSIANATVSGAGAFSSLAQVGLTVGDGGLLTFDSDAFTTAFSTNPTDVQNLFSQPSTGLGNVINNDLTTLTDATDGIITLENNTLGNEISGYQDQITFLDGLISDKRNILEAQFANMESTLATLQGQQSALASLTGVSASSTSSSSSSSSSSS